MLTILPHTSHKLQPFDRTVLGSYKTNYKTCANEWMMLLLGQPKTLYDIAEVIGNTFYKAFTPSNIIKGFKETGIYPVNENVFEDDEFLTSYVTDRPIHSTQVVNKAAKSTVINLTNELTAACVAKSTSHSQNVISPIIIRPFPKDSA